jgi:hypothetical protein
MMKKIHILQGSSISKMFLLTATACLLAGGVDAQSRLKAPGKLVKAEKAKVVVEPTGPVATGTAKVQPGSVRSNKSVNGKVMVATKTDIATSANIYGSLVSEGTLADYNGAVNVLSYTNRKSIGVVPPVSNSGIIQTHFSYDKGATWDTNLVCTSNAAPVNRYPNGIVANPPGNTTANQAYAVVAAPLLDGSLWDGGTFASIRLDGQNASQLNIQNASATVTQWMPRIGMCSGTNGNVYVLGNNYDYNATAPVFNGAVVNRGVWDAANNSYTWSQTNLYHAFSQDPADGSQNISSLGHMAFSADGQTGYVMFIGRDSIDDHLSPMPIIYRTTDAGATWSLYYNGDFSPLFAGFFPANGNGVERPFWYTRNSSDIQVDAYGKLHILCEVGNASSNDPDSLNFLNAFGTFFDVYETSTGQWNALWVGQGLTEPDRIVAPATTNTFGWAVDFDSRLQMARSADGTKMAYMWMDTDTLLGTLNLYPDLKGAAADFANGLYTDEVNFTQGGAYDANNYFMCVAGEGWDNTGNFVVPVMTSRPLNSGGLDTNPWMHEWVGGIEFAAADYVNTITVGVNELPINANTISVFPNPTANVSNLVIDLKSNANVNVNIVNGIGQVVKSFDFGFATAGSNSFSMDLSTLSTGIYVIQMNIGGEVATRVLSIQK